MTKTEARVTAFTTTGITMILGLIWKFFPTQIYSEYAWLKGEIGLVAWIFGGISLLTVGIFAFILLTEIFQTMIWKAEKRFIRRFNRHLHWSIGLLTGMAIQLTTSIIAIMVADMTFNMEKLLSMDNGLWPIILVGAIAVFGCSFGSALFSIHARIANYLNPKNPPFFV